MKPRYKTTATPKIAAYRKAAEMVLVYGDTGAYVDDSVPGRVKVFSGRDLLQYVYVTRKQARARFFEAMA